MRVSRRLFSLFRRKSKTKLHSLYDSLSHYPVLYRQVIESLENHIGSQNKFLLADCTFGGGGHTRKVFQRFHPNAHIVGIDLDQSLIEWGTRRFQEQIESDHLALFHANFINLQALEPERQFSQFPDGHKLDAILLDLGYNNFQLENPQRGFSYSNTSEKSPLDMRYDAQGPTTAADILELQEIFKNFGEEKRAGQIVKGIVEERDGQGKRFHTTQDLAQLLLRYQPAKATESKYKYLSRCFQKVLALAPRMLNEGGLLMVIDFHSLESKIIETYFKEWERRGLGKRAGKYTPSAIEIAENSRSRSAKLRVFQKRKLSDQL